MTGKTVLILAPAMILLTTCQTTQPKRSTLKTGDLRAEALAGNCKCETVVQLLDDLAACETRGAGQPCASVGEAEKPDEVVVTKTVSVPGPPKRCGGERPKIMPVPQSECQSGMVCLDDKGQRALAINLAAYEAWVNKVIACEGE